MKRQLTRAGLLSICLFSLFATATISAQLKVGDTAPGFNLPGTDGQDHSLDQGNSWVILAWFPRAYTRGCTIECKSLAENGHLLQKFDASYYMVSVDPLEDNAGFAKKEGADFPLLSDTTKQTAQLYGVLSDRGYAVRHTYYINDQNIIVAIDRDVKPATSAEDMAETLDSLNAPLRKL